MKINRTKIRRESENEPKVINNETELTYDEPKRGRPKKRKTDTESEENQPDKVPRKMSMRKAKGGSDFMIYAKNSEIENLIEDTSFALVVTERIDKRILRKRRLR